MTDVFTLLGRGAFFRAPFRNSISSAWRPTMRSNAAILASYSWSRSAAWASSSKANIRSDVGGCLSPDGDAARAGRQDAVRNPSPHVAAFNWVQAGQSGCGYAVAATLSRPQEHPAYGSI